MRASPETHYPHPVALTFGVAHILTSIGSNNLEYFSIAN